MLQVLPTYVSLDLQNGWGIAQWLGVELNPLYRNLALDLSSYCLAAGKHPASSAGSCRGYHHSAAHPALLPELLLPQPVGICEVVSSSRAHATCTGCSQHSFPPGLIDLTESWRSPYACCTPCAGRMDG